MKCVVHEPVSVEDAQADGARVFDACTAAGWALYVVKLAAP